MISKKLVNLTHLSEIDLMLFFICEVEIMKVHVGDFFEGKNQPSNLHRNTTVLYQSCAKLFISVYNIGNCPHWKFCFKSS